ncbi:MAG: PAS domain-containing protein, partial [Saprospiraceae bacterium]
MNYLKEELYELIKSDDRIFDYLQHSSLDGLWYWDLENQEEEWMNPTFWKTLGYDPAEMPHKSAAWQDVIHPDDLPAVIERLDRHMENPDHPYDQIVRYRHKEGSTVWIRCRGLAIRDEAGKPLRMLGAHVDVTEQMRAQQLLDEAAKVARVGSWEMDLKTDDLRWSSMTREILRAGKDHVPDLHEAINMYKEGESRRKITQVVSRLIEEGIPFDEVIQLIRFDKTELWVRCVGYADFLDGECVRIYGIFQDIDERKKKDLKLQQSESELRQVFQNSPAGMATVGLDGRWQRTNQALEQMLGYMGNELTELTLIGL